MSDASSGTRPWAVGDLARHLRERFAAPPFSAGDRLPSERTLSAELGAHRATVRRAMLLLAEQGAVVRGGPRSWLLRPAAPPAAGTVAVLSGWSDRDIATAHGGSEPAVERGAIAALHARGRDVLQPHLAGLADGGLLQRLHAAGVGGVIASHDLGEDAAGAALLVRLRAAGIHVVCQGLHAGCAGLDAVVPDHAAGAAALVAWLADRGCRRILRLWPMDSRPWWLDERDRGFAAACRELGLDQPAMVVARDPVLRTSTRDDANLERRARHLAGWLLGRLDGVDAVMTATDWDSFGVGAALRLLGRALPVVGYDHVRDATWESALMPGVPAATIDKDNAAAGAIMAEVLLERMAGGGPSGAIRRLVPPRLVVLG